MKTIQFKKQSSKAYRIIDLFAGIGGIRLGFESSGRYRTVFSSEIDRFARETYRANFGEEPAGDITAISADTIPDADVVVGGTPCQAFSLMGKRGGFEDARGTLFYDFLRVIRAKRPKAFLMENVAGLPSHDKGRTFRTMLGLFERAGYRTTHRILDARDFGLPQKRRRIFVVGFRNDIPADFGFPEGNTTESCLADVLETGVAEKFWLNEGYLRSLRERTERNVANGNGFGMSIVPISDHANTLTVGGSGRERNLLVDHDVPRNFEGKNPDHIRTLTPRECARLQGFPESFRIPVSDTQAYRQFGNSVPVAVITAIAGNISIALDDALTLPKAA